MAEIPWWAWIAIVAITMWGLLSAVHIIAQRPSAGAGNEPEREEMERLKRRVDELEYRLNRLGS